MAAALLAALAIWCSVGDAGRRLDARLHPVVDGIPERGRRRAPAGLVAGASVAGIGLVAGGWWRPALLAGAVLAGVGVHLALERRRGVRAAQARRQVVQAGETLAGLLRVGAIPAVALQTAAEEFAVLSEAGAAQQAAGDVVGALRKAAAGEGREGLADLAAAWEVAALTGASLSESIDAVATELGRREEAADTVRVEMAATRTAGLVLACLPLVGIGAAYTLQSQPIDFLLGNLAGNVLLFVAAALVASGLLWTDHLAARASR